jgi:hypothetical protein
MTMPMSDPWDFYFRTVDDRPTSCSVNLGVHDDAPMPSLSYVATVRVRMRNPRPDGLSTAEEANVLWQIEDALVATIKSNTPEGIFVGRVTSAGNRDLFFYLPLPESWASTVEAAATAFPCYEMQSDVWQDCAWQTYFGFLVPNAEQRQMIENRKVCEVLERHGDALTEPREIDHWIYFHAPVQRSEFAKRVAEIGFRTRCLPDRTGEEMAYGLQIFRVDLPSYAAIDDVTLPLFRLAEKYEGEYDGWETVVLKPS